MRLAKVAAAVLNQMPLDWDGNRANILAAIESARTQNVSLLCLPELCITGYGCEDAVLSADVCRRALTELHEVAKHTSGIAVSAGLPLIHRKGLLNVNAMICDGVIAGFVAKRHLAGDGIHYEPRWFKPWPADGASAVELNGKSYPLGNLLFDIRGIRVGFEICEDAWVADRPGRSLALDGVDIILNPSASHFAFGKLDVRKRLVLEGSRAFGVTYVYSNLLGNEAGRAIYDGGAMIASAGRLIAQGPRFSYLDQLITTAVVDIDATRTSQAKGASFTPAFGEASNSIVKVDFELRPAAIEPCHDDVADWEESPTLKEEEFARAVSLALFDYLRKSRSAGFVVSLSGGADSAAVSCLAWMAIRFAVAELGISGVARKLPPDSAITHAKSYAELANDLITCVYQSTRNSTPITRNAATAVANALGAAFVELDIDRLNEGYTEIVAKALGRALNWKTDDIALQNIQARTRGPGVWMIANLKNALLLATSNRSEAAVGYATMDGDTCGGLSPIAGIDKAFLRRWLRWLQNHGPDGLGSIPALEAVNQQQPTAELRPPSEHQTDEDDLMPYEILDAVEKAAIRDKYSPIEVYESIRVAFPNYASPQIGAWIDRFFRLWCHNQWKRERYAPSFHLDDENLDPKTWCRFPILSGGFHKELAELREIVAANP